MPFQDRPPSLPHFLSASDSPEVCVPKSAPKIHPKLGPKFHASSPESFARKCARSFSRNLSRNSPPKFLSLFLRDLGSPKFAPPPNSTSTFMPNIGQFPIPKRQALRTAPGPFLQHAPNETNSFARGKESRTARIRLLAHGPRPAGRASTDSGSSKQARSFRHRYPDSGVSESEQ